MRLELPPSNVANAAGPPRKQAKPEMKAWSVGGARRFVAVLEVQNHPYHPLFCTALSTGMRRES